MRKNAPQAVELMMRHHVSTLRRHLFAEEDLMKYEFFFIDVDNNSVPERDIVARLWKTLTYRPDVAPRVEQLCQGEDIGQERFADFLREATEAADWPEDLW